MFGMCSEVTKIAVSKDTLLGANLLVGLEQKSAIKVLQQQVQTLERIAAHRGVC